MKSEDKPYKSAQDQIAFLESRGISFADKQYAARFLQGKNGRSFKKCVR